MNGPDTEAEASQRARAILEQRARELARRPQAVVREGSIEVVEFTIAGERYAIRSRDILAVFALSELVPIPGATAPVAGLAIWRGNLLTLLDVRSTLGLSASALNDLRNVIVLGDGRSTVGILVDLIPGIATRFAEEFRPPEATGERGGYARGISSDAVMLIDGAALAHQHGMGGLLE